MTADPPPRPSRLEIFVDGSNFNAALARENIGHSVDPNLLATRLSCGYHFVKLRYYTSPLADAGGEAYRRQKRFFDELRRSRRIERVLGRHEPRWDQAGRRFHVEKETDVNLAVDMVIGAYEDRFDVAMLVAGDTGYVRAIHAVQARGKRDLVPPPHPAPHAPARAALRRKARAYGEVPSHLRTGYSRTVKPRSLPRRAACRPWTRGLEDCPARVNLHPATGRSGHGGPAMSSATMDVSIDQLRGLPLEKRLEIIEALWDSVEAEAGSVPIPDEIADEADREFAAHLADPSSSIPWETVRARLRERYG